MKEPKLDLTAVGALAEKFLALGEQLINEGHPAEHVVYGLSLASARALSWQDDAKECLLRHAAALQHYAELIDVRARA